MNVDCLFRDTRKGVHVLLVGLVLLAAPKGAKAWERAGLDSFTITAVAVHPSLQAQVIVGTAGNGIFISTDGGKEWEQAVSSGTINCIVFDALSPTVIYAGTAEGGVLKSINGGRTFKNASTNLDEAHITAIAVDPSRIRVLYAGTPNGCYSSFDQAVTWHRSGLENQDVTAFGITTLSGRSVVYAGTRYNGVFKSDNNGGLWRPANEGLVSKSVRSLMTDPNRPGWVLAGTFDEGAYESTDNAALWNTGGDGIAATEGITTVGAVGSAELAGYWQYAAGYDKQVYWRHGPGATWQKLGTHLPALVQALGMKKVQPARLFVGTNHGLFVFNEGETLPALEKPKDDK
jgi:ligand-binding sensor domain-containing protein